MPNRCGIMHVRGSPTAKISSAELSEYCRNFENKMSAFLQPPATLSSEEYEKLGAKNSEAYPFIFIRNKPIYRICTKYRNIYFKMDSMYNLKFLIICDITFLRLYNSEVNGDDMIFILKTKHLYS